MWYMSVFFYVVFFFKQKSAYELRISDWSSDVCSSDRPRRHLFLDDGRKRLGADDLAGDLHACDRHAAVGLGGEIVRVDRGMVPRVRRLQRDAPAALRPKLAGGGGEAGEIIQRHAGLFGAERLNVPLQVWGGGRRMRSEEHTSELQSLMRISYAVFCLKKKQ